MAERHWNGEGDLVGDEHPVRPVLGRAAEEIAPGILTFISVASVNTIESADGLVMLDTGGQFDSDHLYDVCPHVASRRSAHRSRLQPSPHRPRLQDSGASRPRPPRRGGRRRRSTPTRTLPTTFAATSARSGWNAAINQRQFALPVENFTWPDTYR